MERNTLTVTRAYNGFVVRYPKPVISGKGTGELGEVQHVIQAKPGKEANALNELMQLIADYYQIVYTKKKPARAESVVS